MDPDAATTCTYDSDCSDDQACCDSGTDRVCTAPRNNGKPCLMRVGKMFNDMGQL